jgi:hypothetical protein
MNVVVAASGALTLTLAVAGCGSSPRPYVQPDRAGKPTWAGCHSMAGHSVDYVAGIRGKRSVGAAIAPYRKDHDHVVVVPRDGARPRQWLLVDHADVIHTSLEVSNTGTGWLVDEVEYCAQP